ncbi:MAG: ArsR family transcriptional regulator [Anaerolineales bacterium]|nr:ArsR family transcriptional regulator [Anaerolineales bacterium]
MPTSRQQILAYIRKHGAACAADISSAMQMTPANARHHLAHLEANGLIEVVYQRHAEGRGRPVSIYGLSRAARGDNLEHLAGVMLDLWQAELSPEKRERLLRGVAHSLATGGRTGSPGATGQAVALTRRLAQTVDRLNVLQYQARWEAGAAGPRIILGHCPYAGIVESHAELCRVDAFFLEECLGMSAHLTAKLEPGRQGLPFCSFALI